MGLGLRGHLCCVGSIQTAHLLTYIGTYLLHFTLILSLHDVDLEAFPEKVG